MIAKITTHLMQRKAQRHDTIGNPMQHYLIMSRKRIRQKILKKSIQLMQHFIRVCTVCSKPIFRDPTVYKLNHSVLTVTHFMETSIDIQKVQHRYKGSFVLSI